MGVVVAAVHRAVGVRAVPVGVCAGCSDLQQGVVDVVDLQGGVGQRVPGREQGLHLDTGGVAVDAGLHEYVCRQRGLVGGDGPHVQVVDFHHVWLGEEPVTDGVGVQAGGGGCAPGAPPRAHAAPPD